jgi:superfamily II DNA or RNA helicase
MRLDGKGLKKWFPKMVQGPTVSRLIDMEYLSPFKIYAPVSINVSGLHTRMGDYVREEVEAAVNKPSITGNAIQHYIKYLLGKRAVVFCASIKHSKAVADAFNFNGISAAHIDGDTSSAQRDEWIGQFNRDKIKVISNVDLFGEGFNVPAMEGAILLRPTQSLGLYLQQCGRALRPYPGKKEAIILDHAGNCLRHGLPDEDREWTLEDRAKPPRKPKESSSVKLCPQCLAAQLPGRPQCKYCDHIFEIKSRKIEEREGELSEISSSQIKKDRKREQGRAQSLQDLIQVGKQRRYKNPYAWARYIFNARQAKRLGR